MPHLDRLKGIFVPVATPLTEDEKVDKDGMKAVLDHLMKAGVHGIFALGGTGEFNTLTDREKVRVVETVMDEVGGRLPVIAGITDFGSTKRTIENARAISHLGVEFFTAMPPYFGPMQQDWIIGHYQRILEEVPVPPSPLPYSEPLQYKPQCRNNGQVGRYGGDRRHEEL